MSKPDEGSWLGGLFMMGVGWVLWFGLSGFWWGVGAVVAFLSGTALLPPVSRWLAESEEKEQEKDEVNPSRLGFSIRSKGGKMAHKSMKGEFEVLGSKGDVYIVDIMLSDDSFIFGCSCPAASRSNYLCKHRKSLLDHGVVALQTHLVHQCQIDLYYRVRVQ